MLWRGDRPGLAWGYAAAGYCNCPAPVSGRGSGPGPGLCLGAGGDAQPIAAAHSSSRVNGVLSLVA